ncbi:hypothetical protein K438DRAFT_1838922 [Mycena galopus ATCC 62051]|nr:hypothetical protein K438DRAFT_1838922 [Mycena galopus ATCC 62051]
MSNGFSINEVELFIYELQVAWSLTAVEVCLYGGYFVLVAFYLRALHARGMLMKNRFLAVATIVLFILCTFHCAFVLAVSIMGTSISMLLVTGIEFPASNIISHWISFNLAANAVYVTSNVLADVIFIYRCYAIWNSRLTVVLLPIFLTLAVAGVGYFNVFVSFTPTGAGLATLPFFTASIVISLVTTSVLMALTVGRVWWLARDARHLMGEKVAGRYRTVYAMMRVSTLVLRLLALTLLSLESGAVYLAGGVGFMFLLFLGHFQIMLTVAVLGQLVGIAPTIIAVRVGLGHSVESADSFLSPKPRR